MAKLIPQEFNVFYGIPLDAELNNLCEWLHDQVQGMDVAYSCSLKVSGKEYAFVTCLKNKEELGKRYVLFDRKTNEPVGLSHFYKDARLFIEGDVDPKAFCPETWHDFPLAEKYRGGESQ